MNITFQGNPVTIKHEAVKENETLKPFTAIRNDMSEWRSEDSTGTRIFLSVPSLDTGACGWQKHGPYAGGWRNRPHECVQCKVSGY